MTQQPRSIQLPESLCADAERQFGGKFENIEALLTFVLEELTRTDGTRLDESEEKMLEHRLRELGYL